MLGNQFTTNDDGEVMENLTQSHVDQSKHRILPDAGSLVNSFMTKGAYHLRNRLFGKGVQDVSQQRRVSPAQAVFR
ncbi:hypothetical protein SK128_026571, partial [Halocaridina rubra]